MQYKQQRCKKNTCFKSKFLKEIITSWTSLNFNNNIEYFSSQFLWNNSNLKHNNKTIFYKEWNDLGINQIDQLFDQRQKQFFTFQYLKNRYRLNNSEFLKYYTIIQSIPNIWKHTIKRREKDGIIMMYIYIRMS